MIRIKDTDYWVNPMNILDMEVVETSGGPKYDIETYMEKTDETYLMWGFIPIKIKEKKERQVKNWSHQPLRLVICFNTASKYGNTSQTFSFEDGETIEEVRVMAENLINEVEKAVEKVYTS